MTADEQIEVFVRLSGRLVTLRSLIAPVAKELKVPAERLEEIQRLHRSILSGLEILAVSAGHRTNKPEWGTSYDTLTAHGSAIRMTLLACARALRSGHTQPLSLLASDQIRHAPGPDPDTALGYEMQGSYWLAQRLAEQAHQLAGEIAPIVLK